MTNKGSPYGAIIEWERQPIREARQRSKGRGTISTISRAYWRIPGSSD